MNINFGVAAISDRGRGLLPSLWDEALRLGGDAYDMESAFIRRTDRRAVVNAGAYDETWNVPTMLEDEHGVLALSQPPVSYETEIEQSGWTRWALSTLREDRGRRTVHPGYSGIALWADGGMEMWSDLFGFSRSYVVQNSDFAVMGNHIGMVSLFSSSRLEVDEFGADVLSQVGFWPLDNSPIANVKRVGSAEVIAVGRHDEVTRRRYAAPEEYFQFYEGDTELDAAAASLAISTSNAGALMSRTPTVHLSGGQDSRLTAAAWIAGGRPGRISTVGDLQGEVDVASALIDALAAEKPLETRGLTHNVVKSNPRRRSEFSIEDRVAAGMRQWDGDFAPGNLRAPITRPPRRSPLTIGGGNGEIMHPIYYSNERALKAVRNLEHPLFRIPKAFPARYNVERVAQSTQSFIEGQVEFMRSLGQHDATAFNIFQMMSKFRRWLNSQLTGSSFVLLANPVFVKASIRLTPKQRLDRVMQRELTGRLVHQWGDRPYFKASPQDFKSSEIVQASRLWNTSPGSMERMLNDDDSWKRWFDEKRMLELQDIVQSGDGSSVHESNLTKAFVVNGIPSHIDSLDSIRRSIWGW